MANTETPNPMPEDLPPAPHVPKTTISITGILVDVYGPDELPDDVTYVSVLWLHNPRLGSKERMTDIACRCVGTYNSAVNNSKRILIAVAFDQRNHGSRKVHPLANQAWNRGNPTHAQDMFGIVSGTVVDTQLLIDALGGYLYVDRKVEFDQHLVLGVSLGGHSGWQLMFRDPRVTAAALIIGCPDFQHMMKDRARLTKLETYTAKDKGQSFLGTKDFPPALVKQCAQYDPKGILFGTGEVTISPSGEEQARLRKNLDSRIKGKKFLICSGADDKLVPYRCSESFNKFFTSAAETWYQDGKVSVENKIYSGCGHEFNHAMVNDAVRFVFDAVVAVDSTVSATVSSSKI